MRPHAFDDAFFPIFIYIEPHGQQDKAAMLILQSLSLLIKWILFAHNMVFISKNKEKIYFRMTDVLQRRRILHKIAYRHIQIQLW